MHLFLVHCSWLDISLIISILIAIECECVSPGADCEFLARGSGQVPLNGSSGSFSEFLFLIQLYNHLCTKK